MVFPDRVYQCSFRRSGTPSLGQAGFELKDPPTFASPVGLKTRRVPPPPSSALDFNCNYVDVFVYVVRRDGVASLGLELQVVMSLLCPLTPHTVLFPVPNNSPCAFMAFLHTVLNVDSA